MTATVALLPGDGIGPEIVDEARKCLEVALARAGRGVRCVEALVGGRAIDLTGSALPPATLELVAGADAVLLGAVGGPRWDDPQAKVRPEQGLLALRKEMGVWANLRPVRPFPELAGASPLKPERIAGVDLLCIRELTGGLYFGEPKGRTALAGGPGEATVRAVDTLVYTDLEIRRVVTLAFRLARGRRKQVTSIDKANVLESSRLWRQIAGEVAREFPDVTLEHQLVDSAAMRLVTAPAGFDVIVTENMFGDILTDEAAVLAGSLGLLPSASLGDGARGLYEPIHGSAPDLAGQGVANPIGTILSAALLLRHSLGLDPEARRIERAVSRAIADGLRTADLGGAMSTAAMGAAIRERMEEAATRARAGTVRAGARGDRGARPGFRTLAGGPGRAPTRGGQGVPPMDTDPTLEIEELMVEIDEGGEWRAAAHLDHVPAGDLPEDDLAYEPIDLDDVIEIDDA